MPGISGRLDAALAAFDGISGGRGEAASHAHEDDDRVVLAMVFDDNVAGRAAGLVANHILTRLGTGTRLDGRAPVSADAALDCGCGTPDATFFGLSAQQAVVFDRALRYAADMGYDPYADHSSNPRSAVLPLTDPPLFVSLSRAFATYCDLYGRAGADKPGSPSLGLWSNVLRPLDDGVPDPRQLVRRAVVSRRAIRGLLRDLERLGWLVVDKSGRGRSSLSLTAAGLRARESGAGLVGMAESGFATRFGADRTDELRSALVDLVDQLEIELPWYLTGYGLADSSLTGGHHVPAQPGPPRIPAHGADWPVVLKDPNANVAEQPLSALLSKALAAFRIDYEWAMRGHGTGLDFVANCLQYVDDAGVDLKTASALCGVTGNGRSALERHLVVVAEPRRGRGLARNVYLTPKGKQARDSYAYLVAKVEREWEDRFGNCICRLRGVLDALERDFQIDLPSYPSTTDWLHGSMLAGSAAQRGRDAAKRNPG